MGTVSFPGVKSGRDVTLTPYSFYCRGQERVELYLYSRYGPYGMYRASVPVQGCAIPLPITLLPIRAVQPVQSLSLCTLPIPLLLLWAIQPVQSLSACTTVHFNFTYTSTPPMDRTACTEPQCL